MNEADKKAILERIQSASTPEQLESVRLSVLGKSGLLPQLFSQLKGLDSIKDRAQDLNLFKETFLEAFKVRKGAIEARLQEAALEGQSQADVTLSLPRPSFLEGRLHPLTRTRQDAMRILAQFGFTYAEGPEVETEYANFDALNFGPFHPARHMHDTFYLENIPYLLRTHTSTVQVHAMKGGKLPLRCMALGPTYRSDSDQTHTPQFHQLEGLCVDTHVHLGHLKGVLEVFLRQFFNEPDLQLRFRPSYFPFTQPSLEVDVSTGSGWLEILGCGMVHPNVLYNCGIDAKRYQGFAFGVGLDRLAMLRGGITDLRAFFENKQGWLAHYGSLFT